MADENGEKSMLEAMPQDVLIRISCGVDHNDLKQLFECLKNHKKCDIDSREVALRVQHASESFEHSKSNGPKCSKALKAFPVSAEGKEVICRGGVLLR